MIRYAPVNQILGGKSMLRAVDRFVTQTVDQIRRAEDYVFETCR